MIVQRTVLIFYDICGFLCKYWCLKKSSGTTCWELYVKSVCVCVYTWTDMCFKKIVFLRVKLSQEEDNVSIIRACSVNFPGKTFTWKLFELTCWTGPKTSNIWWSRFWSKENSMGTNCLQIAQRMIESRGTLHCVCECIPFQVARLPCLC